MVSSSTMSFADGSRIVTEFIYSCMTSIIPYEFICRAAAHIHTHRKHKIYIYEIQHYTFTHTRTHIPLLWHKTNTNHHICKKKIEYRCSSFLDTNVYIPIALRFIPPGTTNQKLWDFSTHFKTIKQETVEKETIHSIYLLILLLNDRKRYFASVLYTHNTYMKNNLITIYIFETNKTC